MDPPCMILLRVGSIHERPPFVHKQSKCFSKKVESGVEELRFWRRFWKIMRILKTSYGLRYCTILLYPAGSPSCLTAATRKGKVNNQIDVLTIMQLNNFSVLHTKRLWSRNWNKLLTCSQFYNKLLLPWYRFTTAILVFLSYPKLNNKPCYVFQQSVC